MKIYCTIRPLNICHPTMRLLCNVSEETMWICEEEDLTSVEIHYDPLIKNSSTAPLGFLSRDVRDKIHSVPVTYHAIEDLPERAGYVVTVVCLESKRAEEIKLLYHTSDRRYILGEHTLIVGCRTTDKPMIIVDFQAIPDATLPLFVSVLIDHCSHCNPHLIPDEVFHQQVHTYNNQLLNALIDAWLASGELVLSEQ